MAPNIKLYCGFKTCSMASQMLFEDFGLPFQAFMVNIRDPAAKAEYVKNVNPKGQVPALSIDGEIITEGPAIMAAISQLVPEKHYAGSTPLETVRAYCSDPTAESAVREKSHENILANFAVIEERFSGVVLPGYAIGNGFTGVDAFLAVFVLWARHAGLDLSGFPRLVGLVDGVLERPAWKNM